MTSYAGNAAGWDLPMREALAIARTAMITDDVPVGALVLGAVVLGERPTVLQLTGAVVMLVSAYAATNDQKWLRRMMRRDQS